MAVEIQIGNTKKTFKKAQKTMSKKAERQKRKAAKKAARRQYKLDKRAQKYANKDARRDDKLDRVKARQSGKSERVGTRQSEKTGRTEFRKAVGLERVTQKGQSGYWSPEAVASRQASVQAGIGALGELGSDLVGAFGGGEGEPDTAPISGGGGGSSEEEEEEEIPLTEKEWFIPAVIAAGAGAIYLMTQDKGKKK